MLQVSFVTVRSLFFDHSMTWVYITRSKNNSIPCIFCLCCELFRMERTYYTTTQRITQESIKQLI